LLVEGLSISHATAQEDGPCWNRWQRILLIGKQTPERWVMPAELMLGAIAVTANTRAQLPNFGGELIPRHAVNVFVQSLSREARCRTRALFSDRDQEVT
jgi:hypothetical protein